MASYDVVVIGAGIIGTIIARELTRYRLKVAILERANDVSMGATKANSAIVHGGYAEPKTTLRGRLCYPGRKQFKRLNEELNFGFRETGSLVVVSEDDTTSLQALFEQGVANGLTDLSIIGADEIRRMEPALSPDIKWALHCRGAGVCSPYEMAIALAENAVANGARLQLDEEVVRIAKQKNGFVVTTGPSQYQTRYVINAAGIHADRIAQMVGLDDFKIIPRSGAYILFVRGTGDPINNIIFQLPTSQSKGVVLTSTYHGNLMIGPDAADQEDREDTSTQIERVAAIYQSCQRLYPDMDPGKFLRSFAGIRAKSTTDDFIIEETSVPGFINVAGIQSPGLTAAPAIADLVLDILENAGLELNKDPDFNPNRRPIITRQPLLPYPEIEHLVDIPPSKEKIICRCEQVTEGEIVDALHRGIPVQSIDGAKRRTRASMGWCQGGFCHPRIAEVMERESGKSIDPLFDIEHSGVNRVGKSELKDYLDGLCGSPLGGQKTNK